MEKTNKQAIFSTMPVPKAIAAMAIPTIISQLINLIYSLVDTFFIGRAGNPFMTSAVTVAFTLYIMTISFANLFGVGGGSLIARLRGVGKEREAREVASYSFYGAIVISLLYSLVIGIFLTPILRFLKASDDNIGFAIEYTLVTVVIGSLPMVMSLALSHLLRNVGYSSQASIGLSAGGVLNMALDPLFMFVLLPPGKEVLGAAIATTVANTASFLYLLFFYLKISRTETLSASPKEAFAISKENKKALYAVGLPSAILTGLFDVANMVLFGLMADYGDNALAAIGIVTKVERIPNAVNIGLCQGMLPIVAFNYASGNRERRREIIRTARGIGLAISFASIVLFEAMARPFVQVFMSASVANAENVAATIAFAILFLRVRAAVSPSQFLNYHSSYCLQAMGDGFATLLHAVVRELIFYIPLMYLMNFLWGSTGLVFALLVGETLAAVVALGLLHRRDKITLNPVKSDKKGENA